MEGILTVGGGREKGGVGGEEEVRRRRGEKKTEPSPRGEEQHLRERLPDDELQTLDFKSGAA